MVVTVETDAGITGIGEGGSRDILEQCAGRLIGQDPQLHRAPLAGHDARLLLPAGPREDARARRARPGAVGHPGKVLGLPVHALLGGMARNYCECYNTAGIIPGIRPGMGVKERARATMEAGYRCFRMGAADAPANGPYNTRERVNKLPKMRAGAAKASARTATGASISTSASTSPTPSAAAT